MTLQPGTRIGAYEITGSLGAGGMGEVYRARDSRLERDVAIKIPPALWLSDPERLARFDREARVLASLNHPHIGAIYGFEESGGLRALVLELIEGPTLADRLARGPLTIPEALTAAVQIADALEAAHERGVIHRDLKPANVIVRDARSAPPSHRRIAARSGDSPPMGRELVVKVVDFGLAKEVAGPAAADPDFGSTATMGATREGALMGTAAYMSPEQARGQTVDKRTDVWAFGCVLYEMLTGRMAFGGASLADTLGAIVEREPDWTQLPERTPAGVRQVLRRCLEKDWRRRLRDVGDARIALEDAENEPPLIAAGTPQQGGAQVLLRTALLVAAAALFVGAIAVWLVRNAPAPRSEHATGDELSEMRLEIATPPTSDPVSLAISPDGKKLAFVAGAGGSSLLWLRPLDSSDARPLPGTEGAAFPFWSPDGRAIGFFADRQLKRIDVEVATVQVIAPAPHGGRGGTWADDGTIVFQPMVTAGRPLVRVASTGGPVVAIESLVGRFPHFLPDGRHLLYFSGREAPRGAWVAGVDGTGARPLVEADAAAVYASGHLLFVRGTTLLAQRFDPSTLAVSGSAFPIASGMTTNAAIALAPLSASSAGPIVFRTGAAGGLRQFVWVDRGGREIAKVGDPIENPLSPALSPDGSLVAFHRTVGGNADIWLLDTVRGVTSPLREPTQDYFPTWSPDGTRLVFWTGLDLYERPMSSGGEPSRIFTSPVVGMGGDWSPDGRHLIYHTDSSDLWVLPLDHAAEPMAFAETESLETDGVFSPDGNWIAYTSDESGELQVYARRFPGPGGRLQVSTTGGSMARWRGDGRELFYVALDGKLMAVPLEPVAGHDALQALAPVPLFDARVGPPSLNSRQHYMVASDGKRFLVKTIAEEIAPPITVVVNWKPRS